MAECVVRMRKERKEPTRLEAVGCHLERSGAVQ